MPYSTQEEIDLAKDLSAVLAYSDYKYYLQVAKDLIKLGWNKKTRESNISVNFGTI